MPEIGSGPLESRIGGSCLWKGPYGSRRTQTPLGIFGLLALIYLLPGFVWGLIRPVRGFYLLLLSKF